MHTLSRPHARSTGKPHLRIHSPDDVSEDFTNEILDAPDRTDPFPWEFVRGAESWADFYRRLVKARKIWPEATPTIDRVAVTVLEELQRTYAPESFHETCPVCGSCSAD